MLFKLKTDLARCHLPYWLISFPLHSFVNLQSNPTMLLLHELTCNISSLSFNVLQWSLFCFLGGRFSSLNYSRLLVVGLSPIRGFLINLWGAIFSCLWLHWNGNQVFFPSGLLVSKAKQQSLTFQPSQKINKPKRITSLRSFKCVVYECGWYVLPFFSDLILIC